MSSCGCLNFECMFQIEKPISMRLIDISVLCADYLNDKAMNLNLEEVDHRPNDHEVSDGHAEEKADASRWLTHWIHSIHLIE